MAASLKSRSLSLSLASDLQVPRRDPACIDLTAAPPKPTPSRQCPSSSPHPPSIISLPPPWLPRAARASPDLTHHPMLLQANTSVPQGCFHLHRKPQPPSPYAILIAYDLPLHLSNCFNPIILLPGHLAANPTIFLPSPSMICTTAICFPSLKKPVPKPPSSLGTNSTADPQRRAASFSPPAPSSANHAMAAISAVSTLTHSDTPCTTSLQLQPHAQHPAASLSCRCSNTSSTRTDLNQQHVPQPITRNACRTL